VQYSPPKGNTKQAWNPSGVAALLEAARVLGANQEKLPVTVELVAYATAGMAANGTLDMGSFHHAKALKTQKVDLIVMLALKSVGYYRDKAYTQQYPFSFMKMLYPDTANFISLSSRLEDFGIIRSVKSSFSRVPDLLVESVSGPENFPLIGGADHENYWVQDFAALQQKGRQLLITLWIIKSCQKSFRRYIRRWQIMKISLKVIQMMVCCRAF